MIIADWLRAATIQLQAAGIQSARLDSVLLLEDVTDRDRSWLLAHEDSELQAWQLEQLQTQLQRRQTHEPLAYIRGRVAFYGREFAVDAHVLIPRPESESLIELCIQIALPGMTIADIGTGSGALAITAALETGLTTAAVDIDKACLAVAKRNAVTHTAAISLLHGSLLEPLDTAPDILLCNLPYVPDNYAINQAARHEPAVALFAGSDGLDLYRSLCAQLHQRPAQFVITESLLEQHQSLQTLFSKNGYKLSASNGLAQLFTRLAPSPAST